LLLLLIALFTMALAEEKKPAPTTPKEASPPTQSEENEEEEEVPAKVFTNVADILKDVKENKLKDLFIRNVKISEDEAKLIASEIETNQQLDRFVLTKNDDLSAAVLKTIVASFSKNQKLRVIGFTKNKINEEGATVIADGIKDHTGLQKFYLYHTDIDAKEVAPIVKSLATLKNLIKSVCIENKIGDAGAEAYAQFLKGSKLTDLILRDCDIKAAGFKAIGQSIKESKTLARVDFSENPMEKDAVVGLAAGFDGNSHLTHVELAFNDIDAEEAKVLAEALEKNKVMKRLDLSENKIGNDGAKTFASFLEKDTPLEKLDLSNNKIDTAGAKPLVEALLKNKNLKRLFFYRNDVDDSLKELLTKAGDRIKSETTDELKFKDDETENNSDTDESDTIEGTDEVEEEEDPKPDAKKPDAKKPDAKKPSHEEL